MEVEVRRLQNLGFALLAALAALSAFAAVASANSSELIAGQYPAYPSGTPVNGTRSYLQFGGEQFECISPSVEGIAGSGLSGPGKSFSDGFSKAPECFGASGWKPLQLHGCNIQLETGAELSAERFAGTSTLGSSSCGPATWEYNGSLCIYSIYPGGGTGGSSFTNHRATKTVEVYSDVHNLKYERSGGGCTHFEGTNGEWVQTWSFAGKNGLGQTVDFLDTSKGAYITGGGSGEAAATFTADLYPTAVASSAPSSFTWTQHAGSSTCTSTTFSAELGAAVTQGPLAAAFSGCTATGGHPTVINMHSCKFQLALLSTGPPYNGTAGVSCEKAGDAIEVTTYLNSELKTVVCNTTIGAQAGHEGVSLANVTLPRTGIEAGFNVKGISYTTGGTGCGSTANYTDGVLAGTTTLVGS
jgi:hypothetical protein